MKLDIPYPPVGGGIARAKPHGQAEGVEPQGAGAVAYR
jgi:hypothetical protein